MCEIQDTRLGVVNELWFPLTVDLAGHMKCVDAPGMYHEFPHYLKGSGTITSTNLYIRVVNV